MLLPTSLLTSLQQAFVDSSFYKLIRDEAMDTFQQIIVENMGYCNLNLIMNEYGDTSSMLILRICD